MNNRIIRVLLVTAGLILASTAGFAATGDCDHAWGAGYGNERGARFDKHMAKLHDVLKLTSAQEPAWSEFSGKMKPVNMDKSKMDKTGHANWKDIKTPDRLDMALDRMKSREQQLAEHAAAVRVFYGTLTTDQQKIFDQRFQAYQHRRGGYSRDKEYSM